MKHTFFAVLILVLLISSTAYSQDCNIYMWNDPGSYRDHDPIPTLETTRTISAARQASSALAVTLCPSNISCTSLCCNWTCSPDITTDMSNSVCIDGNWESFSSYYDPWGDHEVNYTGTWDVICGPDADVDNDGTPDFLDEDTIYGTVSGDAQENVTVKIYILSCGIPQPHATVTTDAQGYYAIGDLPNGRYLVGPEDVSYSFSNYKWVDIPQTEIKSYDFTSAICNILSACEAIFNDQNDACDIEYSACVDAYNSALAAWGQCEWDVCQGGLICNGDPLYECGFPPIPSCDSENESCLETATNEMDQCISNLCQ